MPIQHFYSNTYELNQFILKRRKATIIIHHVHPDGFTIVHVPIEESALRGGDKPVFSLSSNFHTTKEVKPENISN